MPERHTPRLAENSGITAAIATAAPLAPALESLAGQWRARAQELRSWGGDAPAKALERAAADLDAALARERDVLLTLEQGAAESGYSADHLGRLLRQGALPNAGAKHTPRIRRSDLPRKAGVLRAAPAVGISRAQIARSVVNRSTSERP